MNKILAYKAWFSALFGVFLACMAFPNYIQFYLIYFTLAFFTAAAYQFRSLKESILVGLAVNTFAGFVSFNFVTYVMQKFGGYPLPVALLTQFFFNFTCEPHFYLFFSGGYLLRDRVRNLPLYSQPFFWACFYTGTEFLFRDIKIFMDSFGGSQVHWIELAQIASVGGVTMVSFYIALSGTALYFSWLHRDKKQVHAVLAGTIALLIGTHVWGHFRIQSLDTPPGKDLKVALIQGNNDDPSAAMARSGDYPSPDEVVAKYLRLSQTAKEADLIVWPETAYPYIFPVLAGDPTTRRGAFWSYELKKTASAIESAILFGAYTHKASLDYNSAVLVNSQGNAVGAFRKKHLLIFGEHMPLSDTFPALKQLNPVLGDFGRGPGPVPIEWKEKGLKLGANICYEELYSGFMREMANQGAHVYVNLTKDSWFGETSEPLHHLQLSVWRSIENAVPLIRATNTGYTTVVDHLGRMGAKSELFREMVMSYTVRVPDPPIRTVFQRFGDWFGWTMVILSVVFGLLAWKMPPRAKP